MNNEYLQYLNAMPNQMKQGYNQMDPTSNFASTGSGFNNGNYDPNKLHNMFPQSNSNSFNYFNPNVMQNISSNQNQYNYGQFTPNSNMYGSPQMKSNENYSSSYTAGFGGNMPSNTRGTMNDYPSTQTQTPPQPQPQPHVLKRSKKEFFEGANSSKKTSSPLMSSLAPKVVNSKNNANQYDTFPSELNHTNQEKNKTDMSIQKTDRMERMERLNNKPTSSILTLENTNSIIKKTKSQTNLTGANTSNCDESPTPLLKSNIQTDNNLVLKKLIHQIKTIIKSE